MKPHAPGEEKCLDKPAPVTFRGKSMSGRRSGWSDLSSSRVVDLYPSKGTNYDLDEDIFSCLETRNVRIDLKCPIQWCSRAIQNLSAPDVSELLCQFDLTFTTGLTRASTFYDRRWANGASGLGTQAFGPRPIPRLITLPLPMAHQTLRLTLPQHGAERPFTHLYIQHPRSWCILK